MKKLLLILLFSINYILFSQTVTWVNTDGDDLWSNPNNWSTGSVPTSSEDVLITWDQGGGYVLVDDAFSCNNLTITARNGSGSAAGSAEMDLGVSGNLVVNGTTTLNGGNRATRVVNIFLGGTASLEFKGLVSFTGTTSRVSIDLDAFGSLDPTRLRIGSSIPTALIKTIGHSTIEFNSSSNQAIPVISYHHLTLSNGATKTASSALIINGNLTIANSTIFNSRNISLDSNFVNNGIYVPNTSTVNLTGDGIGSDASVISGTAKTNFYNLTVNKTGGVSFTGDSVLISNQLLLTDGVVTTNNKLVLTASASNSYAYLLDNTTFSVPNGAVNGNVIIQKTIDARGGTSTRGNAGFYSSPFSNSTVSTFNTSTSNFFFMVNSNWVRATSLGQSIASGVGFSRRNAKTGERLHLYGAPNNGAVSVALTTGGTGVNMVGNPYPSSINWGLVDKSNIAGSGTAYIYRSTGNFNARTTGNFSIGQGFQVIAIGTTLDFDNSCRITNRPSFLRVNQEIEPTLNILIKKDSLNDESFIQIDQAAPEKFDYKIDAKKLFGTDLSVPSLALIKDTMPTVIYHLNITNDEKIIPVYTKVASSGSYGLSFSNRINFGSYYDIFLFDSKTEELRLLADDVSDYTFDMTVADSNRFQLVFKKAEITSASEYVVDDQIVSYAKDREIFVKNFGKESIKEINIYDISGNIVHGKSDVTSRDTKFDLKGTSCSLYLVKIVTDTRKLTHKIIVD